MSEDVRKDTKLGSADFETIRRAFVVYDDDGPDGLWWRTDGEYAPVTLLVNCNDLFTWGCADCEVLTPANIADLERAFADLMAVGDECGHHADALFCARIRKERPQGAYYDYLPAEAHHLFDACGPLREVGFGNPKKHPSERIAP